MPIVYQQDIDRHTKLGVWHITEDESFFKSRVSIQREITHPHKRLQHYAGRFLIKYLDAAFPVNEIQLTALGKPFISSEKWQFSISHCGNHAAVIIGNQGRVGIDIEIPKPSILKIQPKFLKPAEVAILRSNGMADMDAFTIGWNVKEAMFKWYGLGHVDFKHDMHIEELLQDPLRVKCVFGKELDFHAMLHVKKIGEVLLSYVVSDY